MQNDGSPVVRIVIALENPIYFFKKKLDKWVYIFRESYQKKKKPEQMTVWEADIKNEKD